MGFVSILYHVFAEAKSPTSVLVYWDYTIGNDDGYWPPDSSEVQVTSADGSFSPAFTNPSSTFSYLFQGLTPNTQYYFVVTLRYLSGGVSNGFVSTRGASAHTPPATGHGPGHDPGNRGDPPPPPPPPNLTTPYLSGNLIQSQSGNFELVLASNTKLLYYRRDNGAPGLPWTGPSVIYDWSGPPPPVNTPHVVTPRSPERPALIETIEGNLEVLVNVQPWLPFSANRYVAYLYRSNQVWHGPRTVLEGVTSHAPLIQERIQRNFGMVTAVGYRVLFYERRNDTAGYPWSQAVLVHDFSSGGVRGEPVDVAMIETFENNIELIVKVKQSNGRCYLAHFYSDWRGMYWSNPIHVLASGALVDGVTSNVAFTQSRFGQRTDFEVVVAMGTKVLHYSRSNSTSGHPWIGPVVIHDFAGESRVPFELSMIQTKEGNLELLIRTVLPDGHRLMFYTYKTPAGNWQGLSHIPLLSV